MGSHTQDIICVISHGGILGCVLVSEMFLRNNIILEIISAGWELISPMFIQYTINRTNLSIVMYHYSYVWKLRTENPAVWYHVDEIPVPVCLVKKGSAVKLFLGVWICNVPNCRDQKAAQMQKSLHWQWVPQNCKDGICFPFSIETCINNRWQMNIGDKINHNSGDSEQGEILHDCRKWIVCFSSLCYRLWEDMKVQLFP